MGALTRAAENRSPVERTSLQEAVTRRILDIIRAGALTPGDRLPSARALASQCAVAIPTVREALRRLEATGVIEIRHGSGIYLRSSLEQVILPNPHLGGPQQGTIADLLQARLLLEPYAARQAAVLAGDGDITQLEHLMESAATSLRQHDDPALHEVNMRFHRRIAELSGNRVVSQILDILTRVYHDEQQQILERYDDRGRDHAEHRAILDALRAHDPEQAGALMQRHLAGVRAVVDGRGPAGDTRSPAASPPS